MRCGRVGWYIMIYLIFGRKVAVASFLSLQEWLMTNILAKDDYMACFLEDVKGENCDGKLPPFYCFWRLAFFPGHFRCNKWSTGAAALCFLALKNAETKMIKTLRLLVAKHFRGRLHFEVLQYPKIYSKFAPENRPKLPPKGKDRLPIINFQG